MLYCCLVNWVLKLWASWRREERGIPPKICKTGGLPNHHMLAVSQHNKEKKTPKCRLTVKKGKWVLITHLVQWLSWVFPTQERKEERKKEWRLPYRLNLVVGLTNSSQSNWYQNCSLMNVNLDWDRFILDSKVIPRFHAKRPKSWLSSQTPQLVRKIESQNQFTAYIAFLHTSCILELDVGMRFSSIV